MSEFYDVVDSSGAVIETAAEQKADLDAHSVVIDLKDEITEKGKDIILERAQPQLSDGDVKKLRKQYVTRRLPRVVACQHRLDLGSQPRHRNCETCWFAWFNEHGEIVQQCDEMFQADGGILLTNLQGKKFVHRWRQFMSTVASWQRAQASQEATERNEQAS